MERLTKLKAELQNLYSPKGTERVGFIDKNDSLIEVKNASPKPDMGFLVSPEDIEKHCDDPDNVWAVWHTHPGDTSNLSGEDYQTFTAWAEYYHFIVGNDGVRVFKYDEKKHAVIEVKND